MSELGDLQLRVLDLMYLNFWVTVHMHLPIEKERVKSMKFGVIVKGGRAFSVSAKDEETARTVAKTCLFKGEEIRTVVELEAWMETEKETPEEKKDAEVKEEKAEGEGPEETSGKAGGGKEETAEGVIPPDAGAHVNGGGDERGQD